MNPTVHLLLVQANAILDGTTHVPPAQRSRAAAHLARQALENALLDQCAERGIPMPDTTMRSKLIVLRAIAPPEISGPAQAAWDGLSRACHRHAYELAPRDTEVHTLIQLVAQAGARRVIAASSALTHGAFHSVDTQGG